MYNSLDAIQYVSVMQYKNNAIFQNNVKLNEIIYLNIIEKYNI